MLSRSEKQKIKELRLESAWGAERIGEVLGLEANPSTIHRYLLKEGLAEGRHYRRPWYQETTHKGLHNVTEPGVVQMDVKYVTPQLSGLVHTTYLYAAVDVFSRYKVGWIYEPLDCAFCGKKMTGSVSRGKRKYYAHYTCNNKDCRANPKNVAASKVEKDYVQLLETITLDRSLLDMAKVIALRIWKRKEENIASGRTAATSQITVLDRQIDEYVELIPKARSESLRARYEAKVEELDQQLQALKQGVEHKKSPTSKMRSILPSGYLEHRLEPGKSQDRN